MIMSGLMFIIIRGLIKAGPCRKCQNCLLVVRGHCYPVLILMNPNLFLWGSTRYYLMSSKKTRFWNNLEYYFN
jgi:hypothetical protein